MRNLHVSYRTWYYIRPFKSADQLADQLEICSVGQLGHWATIRRGCVGEGGSHGLVLALLGDLLKYNRSQ